MRDPADGRGTTFLRLTEEETLLALPAHTAVDVPTPEPGGGPRVVLDRILTDALRTAPCYVLFSGGRDSSVLLALAVRVARREGLPRPVPVTARYPGAPESDETRWQELVLDHLGLRNHVVLRIADEERLLGEVATGALRRHGVVWPEAVQVHGARYRHLDPGVVVSGEGGDMVIFGHRMGALWAAATLQRPVGFTLRAAARAAVPSAAARALEVRHVARAAPPWLRPPAAHRLVAAARRTAAEPLRWDAATRATIRVRAMQLLFTNFDAAVEEYGARSVHPFAHPEFVEALARAGGPLGWGRRTEIFRRLFADVLPDAVLARRSKAAFGSTRWGADERDFARAWDGAGFDDSLVDAELLRAEWLSPRPHPAADFLLHVAWAHANGVPVEVAP